MFKLFEKTKRKWTKWKIVSFTESLGWVTITQARTDEISGLKQFKEYKSWINTNPKMLEDMRKRILSLNAP